MFGYDSNEEAVHHVGGELSYQTDSEMAVTPE